MAERVKNYWVILGCLALFCLGCQNEVMPKLQSMGTGDITGEDIAGGQVAGEYGAGENNVGERQAGHDSAGEYGTEDDKNTILSCIDGLVSGPMWIQEDTLAEVMIDQTGEEEDAQSKERIISIYGHHRRFSLDDQLNKLDREHLNQSLQLNDNRWGLREQLGIFYGTHRPQGWSPIEPVGQGFWLASVSSSTIESTVQRGQSILSWRDKIDHALQSHFKNGMNTETLTARLTIWANSETELEQIMTHPHLAIFRKPAADTLHPMFADRELTVRFAHSLCALKRSKPSVQFIPSIRLSTKPRALTITEWKHLLSHPRVLLLAKPEVVPQLLNDPSRDLMSMDQVTVPTFQRGEVVPQYEGWSGREVRVAIMDSGVAVHPDFYMYDEQGEVLFDRVRGELPPSDRDGHGTTVAGILAGNGYASAEYNGPLGLPNAPFQWRGQAPLVREIYSHLMYGTGNASEDPAWTQMFEERDAHLANHSHTFGNGFYTNEPQGYDAFISGVSISEEQLENGGLSEATIFNTPPRPVFLSAGNNGLYPQDNIFMRLHGYYGLLVNLKNGILVGSVESNDAQPSDFSSMGPTLDGRLKPDIMAPGSSDARPLSGFKLELGEIRVHAKGNSGQPDVVWKWGRPHPSQSAWKGQGAFEAEEAVLTEGILSAQTFGSYSTRVAWQRAEEDTAINAEDYESISYEYRIELPEDAIYDPAPSIGKVPIDTNHSAPRVWMLRWGDDRGRGYDETRFLRHTEVSKSGEWTRVTYRFDDEWEGEISRLRITPAIYWGGVYTTSIDGGYDYVSGTSMASPAAAGVGATVLEQLSSQHNYDLENNPPQPALVRGLMIQTARDLSRPVPPPRVSNSPDTGLPPIYGAGPDFSTGYGLIDAWAMSRLIDHASQEPRWLEQSIQAGEEHRITIQASDLGPLRVTLAWDDPPGSIITPSWEKKIIHDLDLAVIAPNGQAHGPWVLSPPPLKLDGYESGLDDLSLGDIPPARRCVVDKLDSLWNDQNDEIPALDNTEDLEFAPRGNQRCLDTLNTNEQVQIERPNIGEYTIVVRGPKAGGGTQRYALIWSQRCALRE